MDKFKSFEKTYEKFIKKGLGKEIHYQHESPKSDFLERLVKEKNLLLHGSYNKDIKELEPRQSNCKSKEFGNMKAVYAVQDPILPIFYAIRDVAGVGFIGGISSGYSTTKDKTGRVTQKKYHFELHPVDLANKPWSEGMVYILPKTTFIQGHNDDGHLIDEWASKKPVKPLATILVSPRDFPYLDKVRSYKVD